MVGVEVDFTIFPADFISIADTPAEWVKNCHFYQNITYYFDFMTSALFFMFAKLFEQKTKLFEDI